MPQSKFGYLRFLWYEITRNTSTPPGWDTSPSQFPPVVKTVATSNVASVIRIVINEEESVFQLETLKKWLKVKNGNMFLEVAVLARFHVWPTIRDLIISRMLKPVH